MSHLERQKYKDVDPLTIDKKQYPYFQLKYDGIWCCALVDQAGDITYHSRTGQVKKTEYNTDVPPGKYIGELMYGSEWSTDPSRQGKFFVFDYHYNHVINAPYRERFKLGLAGVKHHPMWEPVEMFRTEVIEPFWKSLVNSGTVEGVVFRNLDDKWSATMMRAKATVEVDVVVTGYTEGKGKHEGSLGALVVRRIDPNGLPVGDDMNIGGGYSDALRANLWAARLSLPSTIITVTAKAIFKSGKLRHPNFVRIHPDKNTINPLH